MAQNEFHTSLNLENDIYWGTAAPTVGTYKVGDLVLNTAPAAGGVLGWVCTTAPTTFKAVGAIDGPYTLGTISATVGTISTATIPTLASSTVATITTGTITGLTSTNGTITTGTITGLTSTNATIASGIIGVPTVTLAAAAALTIGKGLQLISLGAGDTCTLAAAASHAAGFHMIVKNLANNSVTLATVAGATYADAAAITLAQNAQVVLVGDGVTWYKMA